MFLLPLSLLFHSLSTFPTTPGWESDGFLSIDTAWLQTNCFLFPELQCLSHFMRVCLCMCECVLVSVVYVYMSVCKCVCLSECGMCGCLCLCISVYISVYLCDCVSLVCLNVYVSVSVMCVFVLTVCVNMCVHLTVRDVSVRVCGRVSAWIAACSPSPCGRRSVPCSVSV